MQFTDNNSKLTSTVISTFTAHYVMSWPRFFPDSALSSPIPTFDGRAVVYPRLDILKDYLSWRQVDCTLVASGLVDLALIQTGHINNLYNTTFWALVQQGGMSNVEAEQRLKVGKEQGSGC
jgi:tRNA(His) guanylyltransferase